MNAYDRTNIAAALLGAMPAGEWLTAAEIAERASIPRHCMANALTDIEHASGIVERGPTRRCAVSGARVLTWCRHAIN